MDDERCGKRLQSTTSHRSLAGCVMRKVTTDYRSLAGGVMRKVTTEDGKSEESKQLHIERILKGWRPKTESDETGFGRVIVEELEKAQDLMGEVLDMTNNLPRAAEAVEFESRGGRNRMVRKTREHLEAEKSLRERGRGTDDCQKRAV